VLSPVKIENPLDNRFMFLERLTLDPKVKEQALGRAVSFIEGEWLIRELRPVDRLGVSC